jgi:purine-binding chemotaxis protein CheW
MKGKVLSFYVCGTLCGVDINRVKEIIRNPDYTPVMGSSPEIAGLINHRGEVVTLFELAQILKFPRQEFRRSMSGIILKSVADSPDQAGILIDKPGDVIEVTADMCRPLPSTLGTAQTQFISEVVELENKTVLVLDLGKILGNGQHSLLYKI